MSKCSCDEALAKVLSRVLRVPKVVLGTLPPYLAV